MRSWAKSLTLILQSVDTSRVGYQIQASTVLRRGPTVVNVGRLLVQDFKNDRFTRHYNPLDPLGSR